jgi:hypothetical protein
VAGKRRSRADWEQLLSEVERTGSLERVAERHRVSPKRLAWWRWQLSREHAARPTQAPKRSVPRLLPVALEPAAVAPASIEICVGDVTLHIVAGTPTDYIAALVEALRRC